MKHFISISETPVDELNHVLDVAFKLRDERNRGVRNQPVLSGKSLAMIFEKPSLRTRASFEQAMIELGGHSMMFRADEVGLGHRESVYDVTRVLEGIVQGIMARVFEHQKLLDMAANSKVPVINALSDYSHPCQALADAMTIMDEFGRDVQGRTVAYIGDGNNVARSTASICAKLAMNYIVASPEGYEIEKSYIDRVQSQAKSKIVLLRDPMQAVKNADVIYTDTWVSMGQEAEARKRELVFKDYQVNAALLAAAPKHAIVLHCLPAHRNSEITDEVLDGPQSRVFPEAHNRLHGQKGLLAVLMGGM